MFRRLITRSPALRLKLRMLLMWFRYLRKGYPKVNRTANFLGESRIARDIVVGAYSSIGPGAWIGPKVELGKYVMFAANVTILGDDHRYDIAGTPVIFSGRPELSATVVEDDVWVGQNVSIRAGVRVGRGAIVGMGALVVKDVEPYTIVGGVPARKIGDRFDSEAEMLAHDKMLASPAEMGAYCESKEGG